MFCKVFVSLQEFQNNKGNNKRFFISSELKKKSTDHIPIHSPNVLLDQGKIFNKQSYQLFIHFAFSIYVDWICLRKSFTLCSCLPTLLIPNLQMKKKKIKGIEYFLHRNCHCFLLPFRKTCNYQNPRCKPFIPSHTHFLVFRTQDMSYFYDVDHC